MSFLIAVALRDSRIVKLIEEVFYTPSISGACLPTRLSPCVRIV